MMQADPQRQWFVYFREKEMGPLSETEVAAKLKAGELDSSAYLFTEGMTDWTPLDDINVFRVPAPAPAQPAPSATSAAIAAPAAATTATASAAIKPKSEEARKASEPTIIPAKLDELTNVSAPSAKKPAKKSRPLVVAALSAAIVASAVYYWVDQMPAATTPPPVTKKASPTPLASVDVVANPDASGAPAIGTTVEPAAAAKFDWSDLLAARKSRDTKQGAFRISKKTLGGDRPIIVGAVSPLLEAKSLWVMVYPDNERNLLPVMKVWTFHVPVVDGLFSVGPLHLEGEPLPPGIYHMRAALDGKDLDKVGFEHGTWPAPTEVADRQAKLQQERALFAQKEKASLEQKMQAVSEVLSQLQSFTPKASLGPKRRKEWSAVAVVWEKNFRNRMNEQHEILLGPMFYPELQGKLYDFMAEAYKVYQAMDEVSVKGLKAFVAKDRRGLGGRWVVLRKAEEALAGEIRVLGDSAVQQLKIDEETLKRQLIELSSQN